MGLFGIRHQAVKIYVRVNLALARPIEVGRVDFEYLHQQLRHVLGEQVEFDGFIGTKIGLVGEGEVNVDALFEAREQVRRELGSPDLGVADAVLEGTATRSRYSGESEGAAPGEGMEMAAYSTPDEPEPAA